MGWMMGIEPTTTGVTIRGSTTELHPPLQDLEHRYGVDDGVRTHDHRSHNPGLYH